MVFGFFVACGWSSSDCCLSSTFLLFSIIRFNSAFSFSICSKRATCAESEVIFSAWVAVNASDFASCSAKVSDLPINLAFSIDKVFSSAVAWSARCACSVACACALVAVAWAVARSAVNRSIFAFCSSNFNCNWSARSFSACSCVFSELVRFSSSLFLVFNNELSLLRKS